MALKTHTGSCHCKKVKYEADMDLQKGTYRCNCSYCAKSRNWGCQIKPKDLRWTQGENFVATYKMNSEGGSYFFCKNCGLRLGTIGYIEEIGGDYASVMVSTLDTVTPEELDQLPILYMDGLHDNWFNPPKTFKYL